MAYIWLKWAVCVGEHKIRESREELKHGMHNLCREYRARDCVEKELKCNMCKTDC